MSRRDCIGQCGMARQYACAEDPALAQPGALMAKLQMLKPRIAMAGTRVTMADQSRNPETVKRVRGRTWMETRARWFRDHPLCVECEKAGKVTAANRLDHVVPLIDGGEDDEANYQSLCESHHDLKTAREANARSRA